jgi:hypothetical protein
MQHPAVGMMLEAKADELRGSPRRGLPLHHLPPAAARLPLLALTIPIRFLVRPQRLTRLDPLPAGRDIPQPTWFPFL